MTLRLLSMLLLLELPCFGQMPRVVMETELGVIELALEAGKAPGTTAHFLRYVDAAAYQDGHFWRTVRLDNQPGATVMIQVIQGGVGSEDKGLPPILLERTRDTGLRHLDGTLSMARSAPDSATDQFFICIGDQPDLDFGGKRNPDGQGFAAFGRVVKGMDIVRSIQSRPAKDQLLEPPVKILGVRRFELPVSGHSRKTAPAK